MISKPCVGLIATLMLLSPVADAADANREDKIKMAYLYSLSKYITWPMTLVGSSMQVCIKNDANMLVAADTIKGKKLHGKILQTKAIYGNDPGNCQIIFLGGSDKSANSMMLAEVSGQPVLTMADSERFADEGGIIRLFVVNNTIRFEINARQAKENGLSINERLLSLANRVIQ